MEGYPHVREITTRWNDNDVYGHVNNVEYYGYFDTVINEYLITEGGLDIVAGEAIGLCAESHCSYHGPLAFPRRGRGRAARGQARALERALRDRPARARRRRARGRGLVRARLRRPREPPADRDPAEAARGARVAERVSDPHAVAELLRRRAAGERDDGARLALAIEGGGMRGAVSAGMAIAIDELGLTEAFDAVYGASAGRAERRLAAERQPGDGLRPYADPALIRQYIRRSNALRGRPVVDTRHLVEHLYEHVLPMRFEHVLEHRVRFHPLATDVETGRAVDLAPDDPRPRLAQARAARHDRAAAARRAAGGDRRPALPRRGARGVDPVPRRARRRRHPRARAALAPPAGLRAPVAALARGHRHAAAPARRARAARLPRAPGAAGGRRRAAGGPRGGPRDPPARGLAARIATGVRLRRRARWAGGGARGGAGACCGRSCA